MRKLWAFVWLQVIFSESEITALNWNAAVFKILRRYHNKLFIFLLPMKRQFIWRCPISVDYSMRKLNFVIQKRVIASCMPQWQRLYFFVSLLQSNKFYIDLKGISCRIEWFLSQVHNPKHARVVIFIITYKRNTTIVAFGTPKG